MSTGRDQEALAIFRDACELAADARVEFLDRSCCGDGELRAKVESMLAWDDRESSLDGEAESPGHVREALEALVNGAEAEATADEALPETIGSYRVVRCLGQGGMGVVYEARQEHPARRVAVKVARSGGKDSELARRFELEVQLLARLRHPGIAQIIEAGITGAESGARPFFVMELVDGMPLSAYAEKHLRTARQKLELMVEVCKAVAFAHENGVVHRDLKPDNVLVEASGSPKVMDFGVAKVETAGGFGASTLRTEAGRILGTMGYMSPEQLGGRTDGLGPSADVYSLGVMLYELLTGMLPHDIHGVTLARALAVVTTTDAPLLGVIRPEHRGDIEALVAKALEKDPRHRYADAAALQQDLERHLRGEPILARPAGPLRRLSKWARRNPALATAGLGAFLALATVAVVMVVKNREVRRALDDVELLLDTRRLRMAEQDADELWPARPELADAMQRWLDENRRLVERLPERRAELEAIRREALTPPADRLVFADPARQRRHDELESFVQGLEELAANTDLFASMQARRDFAGSLRRITIDDRRADWDAAIQRVRDNEKYGGLALEPQVGLIPLGQDPQSGLEEFLHFETHADPIPRAGRGARETLAFVDGAPGPGTGIVFVLLPAGTYLMGAQWSDPTQPNFDATAKFGNREGPVHPVPIEAFFLSKYEMTQGQWERTIGRNPSLSQPPLIDRSPVNPVNQVSASDCDEAMKKLGLVVPHEEQWEYGARGGTATVRWFSDDHDEWRRMENLPGKADGYDTIAPVGRFVPNPFGLFDAIGNVQEWCSNHPYPYLQQLDAADQELTGRMRMVRGGSCRLMVLGPARSADAAKLPEPLDGIEARSACRMPARAGYDAPNLGLRPARLLEGKR